MNDELPFSSKIDLWLLIVLMSAVALCLWAIGENWQGIVNGNWLLGLALIPGVLVPLWLLGSLRYFLSDETLRIRCGPFKWRVPIREITAISPTRSPLSSPALSLDRLRIEYSQGRAIMISPEPREEFIRQLEFRRKQATA
jgi:hypothetical protein